jgi:rod shape-determining protein MreD
MGDTQRRRLEEILAREVLLIGLLLGVALLQVGLPPRPIAFIPNIMLLLVVCRAVLLGSASAARWAFYGGVALDLCTSSPLGTYALALLVAALTALIVLAPFSRANWFGPILGSFMASLAYHLVRGLTITLTSAPVDPQSYLLVAAIPDTIATVVPALPVFLMMRWLVERRRGRVPVDVY